MIPVIEALPPGDPGRRTREITELRLCERRETGSMWPSRDGG